MYNVTLTYDEVPMRELFLAKGPQDAVLLH